jgi:hypothetical protein
MQYCIGKKQNKVNEMTSKTETWAVTYASALSNPMTDFKKLNKDIIEDMSISGLIRVKKKAWDIVRKRGE